MDTEPETGSDLIKGEMPPSLMLEPGNLKLETGMVRDLLFISEKNQLVISEEGRKDSNLLKIDLESAKPIGRILPVGSPPNQLFSFTNLSVSDDELSVYDTDQFRFARIKLGDGGEFNIDSVAAIDLVEYFVEDAFFFNDLVYGIPLVAYSDSLHPRFVRASLSKKIISPIGSITRECYEGNEVVETPKQILGMAASAMPMVRPGGDFFALAYRDRDLFEIYDSEGEAIVWSEGPDYFCPHFKMRETKYGTQPLNVTDVSRRAYLDIATSSKYLYLLYSGKVKSPSDATGEYSAFAAKIIFKVDWNTGKLLATYEAPFLISKMEVNANGNTFYVVPFEGDSRVESLVIPDGQLKL